MTEYREQVDRIAGVRDQQTALITQIKAALDGKAAGSSEYCAVTVGTDGYTNAFVFKNTEGWNAYQPNGEFEGQYEAEKGSIIVLYGSFSNFNEATVTVTGGVSTLYSESEVHCFLVNGDGTLYIEAG